MTNAAAKPSAREVFTSPVLWVAYGFGAGLVPRAPGTFGSLVGIPIFLLYRDLGAALFGLLTAALFVAGCLVCGRASRRMGQHDPGAIVFDEIVGQIIACAPLLPAFKGSISIPGLIVAFAGFRLFDIWKPWPIRLLDRRVRGGVGIMLDDVFAGVFAAAVLVLARPLIARMA